MSFHSRKRISAEEELAAKDRIIDALRGENLDLKRKVALLEGELVTRGVDVEALGIEHLNKRDSHLDDSLSAAAVSMGGDSASTLSRISQFDFTKLTQGVVRSQPSSSGGFIAEMEHKSQHEHILGQVRHRRFTLTQEKLIAKKEKKRNSSKTSSSSGSSSSPSPCSPVPCDHSTSGEEDTVEEGNVKEKRVKEQDSSEEEEKESAEPVQACEDETISSRNNSKTTKKKPRQRQTRSKRTTCDVSGFAESKVPIFQLPRGGIYVQTSKGPVQFGIPPESIKDSMKLGLEVPTFFVVPKERFNLKLGLNMCEVEFPAYFNFFIRKASLNLIASPQVASVVRKVIDETLEGPSPEHLFVDQEYPREGETTGRFSFAARPDHVKEINFFKEPREGRAISTDTLVQFTHFLPFQDQKPNMSKEAIKVVETQQEIKLRAQASERDPRKSTELSAEDSSSTESPLMVALLGNGIEIVDCEEEYIVLDDGEVVAKVQTFLSAWAPAPQLLNGLVPKHVTDPPQFGITVLGSSHGFDANGSTSGFVLWMHKKGIMVDPPPNATEILQAAGIIPSMITGIILTHCHADHDAGAFQKILKEGRITLITTQTIFSSFIRKYSIISGFAESFLLRLFEHRIVKIGEHVHWCGGTLRFFYSLHALPCIGFEAMVAGKTFVYSSDTFYEPEGLQNLHQKGYLSENRCQALLDFPFDYDVVLHEAGIPPIHTPVSALQQLPENVKDNLYIIHITEEKAKESGLKLAKAGVENTITIETPQHEHATSAAILQLLRSTDIFRHFTISQASDLLQLCRHCTYSPGEYICRAGEVGKHFYVILSGFCTVKLGDHVGEGNDLHGDLRSGDQSEKPDTRRSADSERSNEDMLEAASSRTSLWSSSSSLLSSPGSGKEQAKVFGAGDYLGELALLTENNIRSADIVALTELSLIKLDKHAFKYLLDTTPGLQYRMERLSKIRCSLSWKAIEANSVLSRLRSTQRSQLQSIMQVKHVKKGTTLWRKDKAVQHAYLLASGQLEFLEMREELQTPFKAGAFFCNISSMMTQRQQQLAEIEQQQNASLQKRMVAHSPSSPSFPSSASSPKLVPVQDTYVREQATQQQETTGALSRHSSGYPIKVVTSRVTLIAKTDADLYYIEAEDVLEFLDQNPGVFIQLIDSLVME